MFEAISNIFICGTRDGEKIKYKYPMEMIKICPRPWRRPPRPSTDVLVRLLLSAAILWFLSSGTSSAVQTVGRRSAFLTTLYYVSVLPQWGEEPTDHRHLLTHGIYRQPRVPRRTYKTFIKKSKTELTSHRTHRLISKLFISDRFLSNRGYLTRVMDIGLTIL